jgi:hypothetical protein
MNPTKTKDELRCTGGVSSSCSTSDIRHVNLVVHPVINHETIRIHYLLSEPLMPYTRQCFGLVKNKPHHHINTL